MKQSALTSLDGNQPSRVMEATPKMKIFHHSRRREAHSRRS